jgi:hypothetical protein
VGSRSALAISSAFRRAAVGPPATFFFRRCSRSSPTAPAASGVAMLVPPMWKYFRLGGKAAHALLFSAMRVDRVDSTNVPGATTSGLMRPSDVGPRLLKATM